MELEGRSFWHVVIRNAQLEDILDWGTSKSKYTEVVNMVHVKKREVYFAGSQGMERK